MFLLKCNSFANAKEDNAEDVLKSARCNKRAADALLDTETSFNQTYQSWDHN
jgi:hypothetical protein